MKLTRMADYIQLDQTRYTLDILKKYDYLLQEYQNKKYATPMEQDLKLRKSETDSMTDQQIDYVERFPYQNTVGLCCICQLIHDQIYLIQWECLQDSARTRTKECKAVLRVLVYLRGTSEKGIRYLEQTCVCMHTLMPTGLGIWTRENLQLDTWYICCRQTDRVAVEAADDDRGLNDGGRIHG
jgi:hypothetical protein